MDCLPTAASSPSTTWAEATASICAWFRRRTLRRWAQRPTGTRWPWRVRWIVPSRFRSVPTQVRSTSSVLYAIGALGAEQIDGALKAMSGEVHADQAAAARGNGLSIHHDVTEHLAMDSFGTARHAWVNATQDGQRSVADQQGSGYQAATSHLTAGVDLFANEGSVMGVGASHGQTSIMATGGRGSIQGNVGIVYARQAAGRVLFDGVASFAADDWSTRRSDPFGNGSLQTHSSGHDTMASLTARLPLNSLQSSVEPYVSVIWQKVERDGAAEAGDSPAALTLDRFSHSGTRAVLGLAANSHQRDPLGGPTTWRVGLAAGVDTGGLLRSDRAGQPGGAGVRHASPWRGTRFRADQRRRHLAGGAQHLSLWRIQHGARLRAFGLRSHCGSSRRLLMKWSADAGEGSGRSARPSDGRPALHRE